ncbi:MAG: hypothetical protein ABI858_00495 [Pseudoxanthomonas sp.]
MNHLNPAFALRGLLVILLVCTTWLLPAAFSPAHADDRCFGAAGMGCGTWNGGGMPAVAFCTGNLSGSALCLVSGGSMTHDPCCAKTPNGKQCGGNNTKAECTAEWDKSVSRVVWAYQWARIIDTRIDNPTGVVTTPLYCAKKNSVIHKNDARYCCSGRADPGNYWVRLVRPSLSVCR